MVKPSFFLSLLGMEACLALNSAHAENLIDVSGTLETSSIRTLYSSGLSARSFYIDQILSAARSSLGSISLDRPELLDILFESAAWIDQLCYMQGRLPDGLTSTYGVRKQLSIELICFWQSVLETSKPSAIVSQSPPHEVVDYALWLVCARRNIPWLTLQYTPWGHIPVLLTLDAHGNVGTCNLERRSSLIQDDSPDFSAAEKLLSAIRAPEQWSDRYDLRIAKSNAQKRKNVLCLRVKAKRLLKSIMGLDTSFQNSFLDSIYSEAFCRQAEVSPDLNAPYVYFPLQYQPELTTSPLGGPFCDQILAIRALASALPSGWRIYVKEHPGQHLGHSYGFLGRSSSFYRALSSIPNVVHVSSEIHSQILIDSSRFIATINGTPGYEALARGKKVLVFGSAWYESVYGCVRVFRPGELSDAISRILSISTSQNAVLSGFAKIAGYSIKFFGEEAVAKSYGYKWSLGNEMQSFRKFLNMANDYVENS